jgi:hypothetical protein
MAVRAASWAFLGLLFAVGAWAAERPAAGARRPIRFRWRPTPGSAATNRRRGSSWISAARSTARLYARRSLSRRHRHSAGDVSIAAENRRERARPDQGVSFGLVMQGGSRMVFDLAKPARIEKAFVVDATDGAPARLVLDLAPPTARAFCARSPLDKAAPPICRARKGRPPRAAIRVRSSCSIPATAASIPAPRGRAARGKGHRPRFRPAAARSGSKKPANTAS